MKFCYAVFVSMLLIVVLSGSKSKSHGCKLYQTNNLQLTICSILLIFVACCELRLGFCFAKPVEAIVCIGNLLLGDFFVVVVMATQ